MQRHEKQGENLKVAGLSLPLSVSWAMKKFLKAVFTPKGCASLVRTRRKLDTLFISNIVLSVTLSDLTYERMLRQRALSNRTMRASLKAALCSLSTIK